MILTSQGSYAEYAIVRKELHNFAKANKTFPDCICKGLERSHYNPELLYSQWLKCLEDESFRRQVAGL